MNILHVMVVDQAPEVGHCASPYPTIMMDAQQHHLAPHPSNPLLAQAADFGATNSVQIHWGCDVGNQIVSVDKDPADNTNPQSTRWTPPSSLLVVQI